MTPRLHYHYLAKHITIFSKKYLCKGSTAIPSKTNHRLTVPQTIPYHQTSNSTSEAGSNDENSFTVSHLNSDDSTSAWVEMNTFFSEI